jgi:hypothetical protein
MLKSFSGAANYVNIMGSWLRVIICYAKKYSGNLMQQKKFLSVRTSESIEIAQNPSFYANP